jgi:hypothetical protein
MNRKLAIVGWVLSVLPALMLFFSASLKLKGGPELDQGMAHLGLPSGMVRR